MIFLNKPTERVLKHFLKTWIKHGSNGLISGKCLSYKSVGKITERDFELAILSLKKHRFIYCEQWGDKLGAVKILELGYNYFSEKKHNNRISFKNSIFIPIIVSAVITIVTFFIMQGLEQLMK